MKIETPPFDFGRFERELAVHLPCRHAQPILGRKTKSNRRPFFRLQCPDCGRPLSGQLKFSKVEELQRAGTKTQEWDFAKERTYWLKHIRYSHPIAQAIHEERKQKWWNDYQIYQASNEWKARVTKVMLRANGLCERCREHKAIHVHHLTYERVGEENLEDLQALCFDCHDDAHEGKLFIDRILRQVDQDLGRTFNATS